MFYCFNVKKKRVRSVVGKVGYETCLLRTVPTVKNVNFSYRHFCYSAAIGVFIFHQC